MIAAPRMTRENVRSRTPSSPSTRLVIPMLVAASASPTKAAVPPVAPVASNHAAGREEGQNHCRSGPHDGRPSDREEVVDPDLEADLEEEDDDAEFGEDDGRLARGDEPERVRPDQEPTRKLPDHRRAARAAGRPLRRSSRR